MPKETAERIIDYPYTASARRGGSSSVGSGVGASAFLGLTDTPSTFAGADGYYVTVDESGGRLLFTALPAIPADFTDLGDVPSSYSGHSLKLVRVNAGETALEFFTSSGAGYTQEEIEDFVAAQFTGNTGVIDATYDDGTGAITLTLDVSAADRYLYSTGADAWAEGTITAFMRGLLDDADAATARTTLGLVIGTNVQAYDAELAAIAGLTSAADRLPYFTGSGTASLATFTGAARNLLDDATAADMRTTLGVTVYDQETVEDVVGAMVSGNTETGISVTYDDGTGKLNFVVAAQDHGGLTGLSDDDHSIYLLLAGRSGGQRVTGIASTGYALEVYRDLASGSTDSPVFYVLQDNASDDQQAVWVKQDGTGTALVLERTNAGMLASFAGTYSLTEGSITFGTGFYRASGSNDQVTLSIIRGTAAETIYNAGVNGDSFRRLTLLADGTFGWGPGSVTRDTFLSRLAGGGLLIQNSDGYKLFATRTGVNGTPQVIIPNGTGDVVRQLKVTMLANDGTNAGSRQETFIAPGGTTTVTAGTTTATLTVNANGEVSIVRTAGAGTLTVTFDMFWQ